MKKGVRITCGAADTRYPGFDNLAIQRALDAAAAAGGGEVLLSAGTYLLADSVRLRDHVVLRGSGVDKTVLFKNPSVKCDVEGYYGFGLRELRVADGSLFHVGDGVYICAQNVLGFHATQTTVTQVDGDTLFLEDPLWADIKQTNGGCVETIFPMVKGVHCADAAVRDMTLEGNARNNGFLEGCRGGAIFLIGCRDICVDHVKLTDFNGEGFSYQQCRNIRLTRSECSYNCANGVHPGSGTVGMLISDCELHHNKGAGIFYCIRIHYNVCCNNRIYANAQEGITVGYRDDHIEITGNEITDNGKEGICFRTDGFPGMAGRYTSVLHNRISGNTRTEGKAQIYAPADLTGFIMFENAVAGPVPFLCDGQLLHSYLGEKQPENFNRIDLDRIPEREYRHL